MVAPLRIVVCLLALAARIRRSETPWASRRYWSALEVRAFEDTEAGLTFVDGLRRLGIMYGWVN